MDSQITPHDHHHHAHGLHQSAEGGEDGQQHHEKKSVLKKVKAKAKKIKDNITKHGHGHDHDHPEFIPHDYDDDDDDDDEGDDVVEDPEIQGAPLYEGAAMRSGVGGQGQREDVGLGMTTGMWNEAPPGPRETTSRPAAVDTVLDESSAAPNTTMSLSPCKLEEDPHAPKDKTHPHTPRNSEVKAHDPTRRGSEEAGESQIFDSFAKMKVNDQPNRTGLASGTENRGDRTSYAHNISAVGLAVSGKAGAAKDYVASKLGYGEATESCSPLEYGKKLALRVTEKLKPGEEDKALSEVISEAFRRRRKDEVVKVGESAFREPQQPPKGSVTESEELTRRLGKEDSEATEKSSAAGRSVVGMVKDTVGSWLGKAGDQSAPSQQSLGTSQGVEGFVDSWSVVDGRRRKDQGGTEGEVRILQDSAN